MTASSYLVKSLSEASDHDGGWQANFCGSWKIKHFLDGFEAIREEIVAEAVVDITRKQSSDYCGKMIVNFLLGVTTKRIEKKFEMRRHIYQVLSYLHNKQFYRYWHYLPRCCL